MKALAYAMMLLLCVFSALGAGTVCYRVEGGDVCFNKTIMTGTKLDWTDINNIGSITVNSSDLFLQNLRVNLTTILYGNTYLTNTMCAANEVLTTNAATGLVGCTPVQTQVNNSDVVLSYAQVANLNVTTSLALFTNAVTDSMVSNTLAIDNTGSVDWAALTNYPLACDAGKAVTTIGDSLTCSAFLPIGGGTLTGALTVGSAYPTGADISTAGLARFGNDLYVGNDVYIGGSILTVVSQNATGNITPSLNISFNLGSDSKYWKNVYSQNIKAVSINATTFFGKATNSSYSDGVSCSGITGAASNLCTITATGGSFTNQSHAIVGRIILNTTSTIPSCAAGNRGEFYSNQSTTGDTLWWCSMNSSSNYNWVMVART